MSNVYWIVPAGARIYWFIVPIVAILLGVIWLMGVTANGAQRSRVEVHEEGIRVRGDLYGRSIPYDHLHIDQARVIDLRGEPAYRPASRRGGTGLPGYAAGWFRLANGEKALVYVTDRTRVVYVPTTDGYVLVLSLQEPHAFLQALRARAA